MSAIAISAGWLVSALYNVIAASGGESAVQAPDLAFEMSMGSISVVILVGMFAGVMQGTTGWRSGQILITFLAVPRRWRVLIAQLTCAFLWWFATGTAAMIGAFMLFPLIRGTAMTSDLGAGTIVRVILQASLAVALAAVWGVSLGASLGSPLWAIGAGFAIFNVLPVLLAGGGWSIGVLPSAALAGMSSVSSVMALKSTALALGWVLLIVSGSMVAIQRRLP